MMIILEQDTLQFLFPEVHEDARLSIDFQRTLRIPDDDRTYPLPPGLGRFPLRHVDDFKDEVPEHWLEHGGIMLPMYQSEALWIHFHSHYPFAVKIATGKICAVSGGRWTNSIHRQPQNYVVVPKQPWLDGYCVEKGVIRQFVAMPLGARYTVEGQLTGAEEHGGLQIIAYPMKAAQYEEHEKLRMARIQHMYAACLSADADYQMGLGAGGKMHQEIYEDPYQLEDWELNHGSRCFIHIVNSLTWRQVTGEAPPRTPITSREYVRHGLPWFDWYGGDLKALKGADPLKKVKSVHEIGKQKGSKPLPENESVEVGPVIVLGKHLEKDQVREGRF